jgi:hypothetical protein
MESLTFTCDIAGRRVTVPAVERGLCGVYYEGKPYAPCIATLIKLAPYHLRAAIERAGLFWGSDMSDVLRLDLNRKRDGASLGAVWARATWREQDCFLEGCNGLLPATYLRVDGGYSVVARDGSIKITVAPIWAEYKIENAKRDNAKPVFLYS